MTDVDDAIADALHARGWYVGASVLAAPLTRRLVQRAEVLARSGALLAAAVGHRDDAEPNTALRGDETQWLRDEPEDASERDALARLHALRAGLNQALYLGAHDLQMHFARYAPGTSYGTHRDGFRDDDSRLVSLVVYLNPSWADDAGGELVLYAADDSGEVLARVAPRAGTMACFLSDRFPHEVLPASEARYSLTGWLRRFHPPGSAPRNAPPAGSVRAGR